MLERYFGEHIQKKMLMFIEVLGGSSARFTGIVVSDWFIFFFTVLDKLKKVGCAMN